VAAGGFRDTSRVAASDTQMFLDILLTNRTAVLAQLERFQADLGTLHRLLESSDEAGLRQRLVRTQHVPPGGSRVHNESWNSGGVGLGLPGRGTALRTTAMKGKGEEPWRQEPLRVAIAGCGSIPGPYTRYFAGISPGGACGGHQCVVGACQASTTQCGGAHVCDAGDCWQIRPSIWSST
jgi:hypothetical protein